MGFSSSKGVGSLASSDNVREEEKVTDEELLRECFYLGLDEKDLPNPNNSITPPKYVLSLARIDYIKLMQKSLYFSKQEAKAKKKADKIKAKANADVAVTDETMNNNVPKIQDLEVKKA